MFIYEFREKWKAWKPPKRIKDNLTTLERKGQKILKNDLKDHVYKLEDKGSCLVRLDKVDYENKDIQNSTTQVTSTILNSLHCIICIVFFAM